MLVGDDHSVDSDVLAFADADPTLTVVEAARVT